MNQKDLAVSEQPELNHAVSQPKNLSTLRRLLVGVLQHAQEGHFVLREQDRVIAEVGDRNSPLRAEVNVIDSRAYLRAVLGGSTGAGEAFIDGWWTTPDISQVTQFFARNQEMMDHWASRFAWMFKPFGFLRMIARRNTRNQAKKNILAHYDLGNDLYRSFLDGRMQYSSAIYNNPEETLADAQVNKLTRLCDRLELDESDHLLEIGTGWGGLAVFAARNYGCRVTTTTISDEQWRYAVQSVEEAGLSDRIQVLRNDYRLLSGQFSKIVSVEMIEAVGKRYLNGFFRKLNELLQPSGLMMLQAITIADQRFAEYCRSEDFIQKHIFPGGFLPSMSLMSTIMAKHTEFMIRDVLDIGSDYARTLEDWRRNFTASRDHLKELGYDDRFFNLWTYYLGYCEGGFRERRISAVQLLASKAPHRT